MLFLEDNFEILQNYPHHILYRRNYEILQNPYTAVSFCTGCNYA